MKLVILANLMIPVEKLQVPIDTQKVTRARGHIYSVDGGCHKLPENIWFVWSFSGEKEKCPRTAKCRDRAQFWIRKMHMIMQKLFLQLCI